MAARDLQPISEPRNVSEQAFKSLLRAIVSLDLTPGEKISEVEIAGQLGVSRQPVRDAFYRLSERSLIEIKPQKATLVSTISLDRVVRAKFIRAALEIACAQEATKLGSQMQFDELDAIISAQANADNWKSSQALDDRFHRTICDIADRSFVWPMIEEHKAHMDRLRVMCGPQIMGKKSLNEHRQILAAMRENRPFDLTELFHQHLIPTGQDLEAVRDLRPEYFAPK